jgi:hypothetical protein
MQQCINLVSKKLDWLFLFDFSWIEMFLHSQWPAAYVSSVCSNSWPQQGHEWYILMRGSTWEKLSYSGITWEANMLGLNKIYFLNHVLYILFKNYIYTPVQWRQRKRLTDRTRRRRKRNISFHAYRNRCLRMWCTGKKRRLLTIYFKNFNIINAVFRLHSLLFLLFSVFFILLFGYFLFSCAVSEIFCKAVVAAH